MEYTSKKFGFDIKDVKTEMSDVFGVHGSYPVKHYTDLVSTGLPEKEFLKLSKKQAEYEFAMKHGIDIEKSIDIDIDAMRLGLHSELSFTPIKRTAVTKMDNLAAEIKQVRKDIKDLGTKPKDRMELVRLKQKLSNLENDKTMMNTIKIQDEVGWDILATRITGADGKILRDAGYDIHSSAFRRDAWHKVQEMYGGGDLNKPTRGEGVKVGAPEQEIMGGTSKKGETDGGYWGSLSMVLMKQGRLRRPRPVMQFAKYVDANTNPLAFLERGLINIGRLS